ncbi:MAG: AbrB/MazE/SpoVT family DNA-binding domain-containing protein [Bacillus sp. (in: firmicutes)]|uniref:AbrB/MazE/SpoVT family DNA-binding domain-containing protein n=1 Tax=Bacillus sp. TaxID=1409 RepID=UPI0039E2E32C
MKATGILRKVDNLGRIVISKETREILKIEEKDALEIFVEGEIIILQKYKSHDTCPITGEKSSKNIILADGKLSLSPEGVKQLCKELVQYLERV